MIQAKASSDLDRLMGDLGKLKSLSSQDRHAIEQSIRQNGPGSATEAQRELRIAMGKGDAADRSNDAAIGSSASRLVDRFTGG